MRDDAGRESREGAGGGNGLARSLDAGGWGLLLIWVGAAWAMGLSAGVFLLGAGGVVLGIQLVRRALHLPLVTFSVFVGICLAVAGIWDLAELRADIVPVLFMVAGAALLISALMRRRSYA